MDHFDDWLRRLNPPRRNNFFTGKMMGVAQFEREQRYGMGQRWLLNRLTLGTGILCGLDVTVTTDGKQLRVAPGVAVDAWGREIVVARAVTGYDPFKKSEDGGWREGPGISDAGDYLLCLSYRECMADGQPAVYVEDCSSQPDCEPDTVVETFALGLRAATATAKGFDCGAWTATVPSTGAASSEGGTVPGVDILRERLLEQFGASCASVPENPCVPLGRITAAKNADGTWASLSLSAPEPRPRIYSQAQLLDMILCLASTVAECCKDGHHTDPTPTDAAASLRVNDLVIGTFAGATAVSEVTSLSSVASTEGPKYVMPSSGPALIAVSFNTAVDTSTLVLPAKADSPRSVSLVRKDPGGGADALVSIQILAVPLDPSVLLLIPALERSGESFISFHASNTGGTGGTTIASGSYTLRLSGTSDPAGTDGQRLPVKSKPKPSGTAAILNGDYSGTFPSGDAAEGGDFVYTFELLAPLGVIGVTIDGVGAATVASGSWTWGSGGVVTILLDFSEPLDPGTVEAGVVVAITGATMSQPPALSVTGKSQVQAILRVAQPQDPMLSNTIDFTLPKLTLRAVDGRSFDSDVTFSIAITA